MGLSDRLASYEFALTPASQARFQLIVRHSNIGPAMSAVGQELPRRSLDGAAAMPLCVQPVSATPLVVYRLGVSKPKVFRVR